MPTQHTNKATMSQEQPIREPGWYWVKRKGDWIVGKWNGVHWYLVYWRKPYSDTDFTKINETRIPEPKK